MTKFTYFILLSDDDKFILEPGGIIDVSQTTIAHSFHYTSKRLEDQLDMIKKTATGKLKDKGSDAKNIEFAKRQMKLKPKIKKLTISI